MVKDALNLSIVDEIADARSLYLQFNREIPRVVRLNKADIKRLRAWCKQYQKDSYRFSPFLDRVKARFRFLSEPIRILGLDVKRDDSACKPKIGAEF